MSYCYPDNPNSNNNVNSNNNNLIKLGILSQFLLNLSYQLIKCKISRNHTDK